MNSLTTRASLQVKNASRSARRWRLRAIEAALAITLLILLASRLVTGDFPLVTVSREQRSIGVFETIVATAVVSLAAWALLALLERFTMRATTIWLTVAIVVLLLSLSGPISQGVDTESTLVLLALHVGAAAAIIPLMWASSGGRSS
jgi:hypothetical protein